MPRQADLHVQIELFYVSENHQLSSSITNDSMGSWQNDDSLTKYTTAPNTRSLSVTSNLQAINIATNLYSSNHESVTNVTTTMAVLFYETPNGSVAVLSRLAKGCSECPYDEYNNSIYTGDFRKLIWIDNSPTLQESCGNPEDPSHPYCNSPFASGQYRMDFDFSVITYFRSYLGYPVPYFQHSIYSIMGNPENPDIDLSCKYR